MKVLVQKLDLEATVPKYQREGDAAFDLCSLQEVVLQPGELVRVPTGLAIAIPTGHVGIIKDRSGLAAKYAIHCLAGVIDENYRGEWQIVLINLGKEKVVIQKGERCAQCLIVPVPVMHIEEVKQLNETNRGVSGFGSSGTH